MKAVFALLLAAALAPAPAQGAEPASERTAEARSHFKQGSDLYKRARYQEAIAEFEVAYRLRPHGVIHYNIAQCHEKLGDISSALHRYHQYLREVPGAKDRAVVQAAISNLEKRMSDKGLQALLVFSEPLGAEVAVDGAARGKTPLVAELKPGKHSLTVSLAGYQNATREITLEASRSLQAEFTLQAGAASAEAPPPPPPPLTLPPLVALKPAASSPAAVPPPPPPPPAAAPSTPPPSDAPVASAPPPIDDSWSRPGKIIIEKPAAAVAQPAAAPGRPITWAALAGGGALVVVGAVLGVMAKNASDEMLASQHSKAEVQALHDRARGMSTGANVLFVVGGAAAATGGVLYFTGRF